MLYAIAMGQIISDYTVTYSGSLDKKDNTRRSVARNLFWEGINFDSQRCLTMTTVSFEN